MPAAAELGAVGVLVPVKAFDRSKLRLAAAVGPERRRDLARQMAARVVAAAAPLPVAGVCDDADGAAWARTQGAEVVWAPSRGLDGAVAEGIDWYAARGARTVVVAHADLPLATDLAWVAWPDGVTLVPDRRDDGTNVLAVPARSGFRPSYGGGSFGRHREEARRLRLPTRIVRSAELAWDVDLPDDLLPDMVTTTGGWNA